MVCQKSAPRTCTWSRFSKAADRVQFFNSPRAKAGSRIFNPKGIDMASVNKATISIATTDRWKDKQTDQLKEATEWHRAVFNGRLAEIAGQYLRKGAQVYV